MKLPEGWQWWRAGDSRLDELINRLRDTQGLPYSTNWDTAKVLIPRIEQGESGMRAVLVCDANGTWECEFKPPRERSVYKVYEHAQIGGTPAEVVCRAWLALQEGGKE
jgi:hypothetical protein